MQLFTSKGTLLAAFAIAGDEATFSEPVDCATRQPSGTGPDPSSATPTPDATTEDPSAGDIGGEDTTDL